MSASSASSSIVLNAASPSCPRAHPTRRRGPCACREYEPRPSVLRVPSARMGRAGHRCRAGNMLFYPEFNGAFVDDAELKAPGGLHPSPGWNRSSRLILEVRMKFLIAIVVTMFFTSGAVHADDRAACRLGCNGSGACLRACDLTTCRQACGGNGTCLQACQPSDCRLGCNGSGACLRDCAERDRGLINR